MIPAQIRIGETAVWQPCARCRRHVLACRVDGLLVRCDPENLTVAGELAARIQNRLTFDVHVYGLPRRMHLEFRHLTRIKAPRRYPVVAAHSCGSELTLLTESADVEVTDIVVRYGKPFPDVPPF